MPPSKSANFTRHYSSDAPTQQAPLLGASCSRVAASNAQADEAVTHNFPRRNVDPLPLRGYNPNTVDMAANGVDLVQRSREDVKKQGRNRSGSDELTMRQKSFGNCQTSDPVGGPSVIDGVYRPCAGGRTAGATRRGRICPPGPVGQRCQPDRGESRAVRRDGHDDCRRRQRACDLDSSGD